LTRKLIQKNQTGIFYRISTPKSCNIFKTVVRQLADFAEINLSESTKLMPL